MMFSPEAEDLLVDGMGPWLVVHVGRGSYAYRALRGDNNIRQYAHRVIMGAGPDQMVRFVKRPIGQVIDCRRQNLKLSNKKDSAK